MEDSFAIIEGEGETIISYENSLHYIYKNLLSFASS